MSATDEDSDPNSWASSPARRRVMQANRSRDTGPEMAIRRILHSMGLRYRVDVRPIKEVRRRADIVFGPAKVAVFVDGCFWHCCPQHGSQPATNADYWIPKLERNIERDRETNRVLQRAHWRVIRVWEHQDPMEAALRIRKIVRATTCQR